MTTVRPTRRGGFSLIELLVVIGILALLAALAAGAFFAAQGGQSKSNTEATLSKLSTLLETRRAAVVRQTSTETIPPAVATYVGSDTERLRSVWLYLRLKQEFPTTKAEATNPIKLGTTTILQPRTTIGQGISAADPLEESAACLFQIVQTGVGGGTGAKDGLENKVATTGKGNQVFRDEWGTPIVFTRMAFGVELDNPPFVPPAAARPGSLDPLDPKGKLPNGWAAGSTLAAFWSGVTADHVSYTDFPAATYPSPAKNWVLTVVSAGANEEYGSLFGVDEPASDNLVSYRLRATAGKRGD